MTLHKIELQPVDRKAMNKVINIDVTFIFMSHTLPVLSLTTIVLG